MGGMEATKGEDLEDCAHMIANATGCFPQPGSSIDRSATRSDGTIKMGTEILRECLPLAEPGVSCATDCCVNPAVTEYREASEVQPQTPCVSFCVYGRRGARVSQREAARGSERQREAAKPSRCVNKGAARKPGRGMRRRWASAHVGARL